ncbi:MAG: nickel-responsive transcriptional regulator NikR [Gemmataceae bacterium]
MAEVARFSVSLEPELLEQFDRFVADGKFASRSEAVRHLLREKLTATAWESGAADVAASLTLVYDHHRTNLAEKLMDAQHEHTDRVVSTLHVHLDHDHCMEVIILRGRADELQRLAAELTGLKGIHQAQLVVARAEDHHHHHHH